MQIVLTREHQSIPWGFRLKGGAEYNVPLSILKVNPGSPAHTKLEHGDVVSSIGNYSALHLKHEEALNIIRLFEYHLPLCIKREAPAAVSSPASSLYWRPNQDEAFSTMAPRQATQFSSSYQHLNAVGPTWPQNITIHDQNKPVESPHDSQSKAQPHHHHQLHAEGDVRSADWLSQYNYQPIYQQTFPIGLQQENAPPLVVPAALIKAMTGSPLGKKPFTYTPGGLDLSHIRESSRVKRYDSVGTFHEVRPSEQQQQRAYTPSFNDDNGVYQHFVDQSPIRHKLKPVNGNHGPQFGGISHENLVKPHKHKDLVNQSISFRMLNRWIHDHEKEPQEESNEQRRHTEKLFEKSEVPASQRYQEREISKFRGENIPSKTFKYLQYITQEELALEQQEAKANPRKEVAHVTQQRTVIASQPVNYESNVVSRAQVGNAPVYPFASQLTHDQPIANRSTFINTQPQPASPPKETFACDTSPILDTFSSFSMNEPNLEFKEEAREIVTDVSFLPANSEFINDTTFNLNMQKQTVASTDNGQIENTEIYVESRVENVNEEISAQPEEEFYEAQTDANQEEVEQVVEAVAEVVQEQSEAEVVAQEQAAEESQEVRAEEPVPEPQQADAVEVEQTQEASVEPEVEQEQQPETTPVSEANNDVEQPEISDF